ncbi:MAG: putative oxidoreductase YcjS [Spirochaetes bacterium ADurb.Bin110]|nr:MAG: putative oxidoreductase YcjS [Spirochaetes bacterium ADurb.Bin110]
MKKLRVAIIGIGKIGISHLKAIKAIEPLGYAELTAICSPNPNKIKSLCDDYDISAWYTSYQEMLKRESLDLVHNCTPNVLHYDVNRDILEAGLYALSEKPLTIDSKQSGALVTLAKNRHLKTAINFVYRYYPIIMHIKELISKGELGTIYSIHGTYLQDWLLFDHDYDWRVESRYGGPSRALADIGSHWIDIAEFLLDRRLESIAADFATFIPKRIRFPSETITVDTEDFASALMRFEGGIHGCLTVSQVSAGRSNGISFEIDGSTASLRWSQEHSERASLKYREEKELILDEKGIISPANEMEENKEAKAGASRQERFLEVQQRMIDNFYRSILFSEPPLYADFLQGHHIVQIIEAAIESNQKARWVDIDL